MFHVVKQSSRFVIFGHLIFFFLFIGLDQLIFSPLLFLEVFLIDKQLYLYIPYLFWTLQIGRFQRIGRFPSVLSLMILLEEEEKTREVFVVLSLFLSRVCQ